MWSCASAPAFYASVGPDLAGSTVSLGAATAPTTTSPATTPTVALATTPTDPTTLYHGPESTDFFGTIVVVPFRCAHAR